MMFAWPHLLWLLALPVALLGWELSRRRHRTLSSARSKILRAEAGLRSLKLTSFGAGQPETRLSVPRFWLFLGLTCAIVALARPQWGRLEEPVFDQSREILLAIDLSRSMQATDVKPSRLDRSKLLIQSLLEKLQGERVGLVVFAGTSFLQSPLSADYEILREFLPSLGPDYLPQGGSDYGALLEASIRAFSTTSAADRFLVILSDGEATDTEWRKQVEELKNKNIRVVGLGVGTADGSMIPDGSGGLIKDDRGAVVLSKLESATLQELAQATGGVYRDASAWVDLAGLVNETIESGRKGEFLEKNTVRHAERFQWPLAFALWCFLLSFYYEFPVRPRVRDLKLDTGSRLPEAGKKAAGTLAALLLLAASLLYPLSTYAAATLATPPMSAPAPAEESPLARVVGRIALAEKPSGRDYAEFARETITWGSRLQSEKRGVPQPPIHDALAGVALGSKLDPKTADWPKLREELEALLQKEEEDKKDQQEQDQPQNQDQPQDQNQQKQDDQKQDQKQKQKSDSQKSDKQDGKSEKNEQGQGEQDQKQKQDSQQQEDSAFGDMSKKDQPPPPPPPEENMQQVGGAEKETAQPPPADPALAIPLQKLDQLRNQDSPAQLFQMMEADKDKRAPKKPTKDW